MGNAVSAGVTSFNVDLSGHFGDGFRRCLQSEILCALRRGERHVVVDCRAWLRLDLPLLSTLIQCAKSCDLEGAVFEVVNMSNEIRANVDALRLDTRLGLAH
jgi:anti-anti-sigma regulatory factor